MSSNETLFDASEITVSMGPQHPSTHGVLQVKLKLDGERVDDAECVIGYLHRGVEKLGESSDLGTVGPDARSHGLHRGGFELSRILRDDREAARCDGSAARAVHPRDHDRAESDQRATCCGSARTRSTSAR